MSGIFENQTALVTGAGRGIGRATALALAKEGCRVALVSQTRSELEQTAEEIRNAGGEARVLPADVSQEAQVGEVFTQLRKGWGPADVLVNSAGTYFRATVAEHSLKEWERVFAVNVSGTFLCTREVFRDGRPASIVNVSSLAGIRGPEKFPGLSSYVASKFAVTGMTEAFAVEGRPLGIRVNALAPGAVDTEMLRKAAPHLRTDTTPDMIAKTILHLADRKASSHLSGSIIEIYSNLA